MRLVPWHLYQVFAGEKGMWWVFEGFFPIFSLSLLILLQVWRVSILNPARMLMQTCNWTLTLRRAGEGKPGHKKKTSCSLKNKFQFSNWGFSSTLHMWGVACSVQGGVRIVTDEIRILCVSPLWQSVAALHNVAETVKVAERKRWGMVGYRCHIMSL